MLYYTMYKIAAGESALNNLLKNISPAEALAFGLPAAVIPADYVVGKVIGKKGTPKEKRIAKAYTHIGNALIGGALSGHLYKERGLPLKYAIPVGFTLPALSSLFHEVGTLSGESERGLLDKTRASIRSIFGN